MLKKSCILRAVRYCNEEIVRYLVEQGAKLDGYNQVDLGPILRLTLAIKEISLLFKNLGLI